MVDGQNIGETPVNYTDSAIAFTSRQVVLEKEGYETTRAQLTRDGRVNAGALAGGIVGGLFCFFPLALLLWSMDYPTSVNYNMSEVARAEEDGDDKRSLTFVLQPEVEADSAHPARGPDIGNSNCYVCSETH